MINLKRYKLKDLYKMGSGISSKPEQAGHGSPFVSFRTIFNNYYLPDQLPDLMDSSSKEQETYSVKKGDILITRTSETLDELAMSSVALKDYPSATFSGFAKRLRPSQNDITYDKFMAFYMRSKFFRKAVDNNAIMTLRASFNEEIFSYIDVLLPDYEEQKKIGDFLFALNSKIQINNEICKELESLAKTIYDFWFVQFDFPDENGKPYKSSGGKMVWSEELKKEIPEGWEVKKVGDLVNVKRGKNITRKTVVEGDIPVIAAGLEPSCYHNVSNTSSPVITVSGSGANAGYIQLHYKEIWASDCSYIDQTMFSQIHFMYLFLRSKQNEVYDMQKGSAQPHVYPQDIMDIKVQVDKELKTISRFETLVVSLFKQIGKSKVQNQKLADLRDWLLPMLMNGQVRIEN